MLSLWYVSFVCPPLVHHQQPHCNSSLFVFCIFVFLFQNLCICIILSDMFHLPSASSPSTALVQFVIKSSRLQRHDTGHCDYNLFLFFSCLRLPCVFALIKGRTCNECCTGWPAALLDDSKVCEATCCPPQLCNCTNIHRDRSQNQRGLTFCLAFF